MADLMLMLFFKKYLAKPIHLFGTWGIFILTAGVGIDIYMLILKIMGESIMTRSLMILGVLLLEIIFEIFFAIFCISSKFNDF